MRSVAAAASLLLLGCRAAPTWPSSSYLEPCDEAVVALATGIHLNIVGQYAEYNGTLNVIQVETEQIGDLEAFYIAKGELLSDIQGGMNIRLFNQEIAPPGNPAIPGLDEYDTKQQAEKALAEGLTGVYLVDKPSLDTLLVDIKNGIILNQENLANATSECSFTLVFPPPDQSGS